MSAGAKSPLVPFLVACLGIATFSGMDVLMKGLTLAVGAYNAMLWRCLLALLMAAALFLWRGNRWPQRAAIRVHVWRGLLTALMAFLFFWGLAHIPIAEAIALTFIAPLIALYLSAALLGERIPPRAIVASLIGLAGGLVIIQGKLASQYPAQALYGIAAILCSAILYAYNLILQRRQALLAGPVEIALFQNLTVVAVYLLLAPVLAVVPEAALLPDIFWAACLGIVSMMLLSWAYARAETRVLIPVEYTAFAWAALFGWLVFGETLTLTTLAGTALIVCGCLLAARAGEDEHIETTAL